MGRTARTLIATALAAGMIGCGSDDGEEPGVASQPAVSSESEPAGGTAPADSRVERCGTGSELTSLAQGNSTARLYFSCESAAAMGKDAFTQTFPMDRRLKVPRTDPVGAAEKILDAYLAGPTREERRAGYYSALESPLPGPDPDVRIDPAGLLVIDFDRRSARALGGPSTSAQSSALLSQLRANMLQIDGVNELLIEIEGNCNSFYGPLQLSPCEPLR